MLIKDAFILKTVQFWNIIAIKINCFLFKCYLNRKLKSFILLYLEYKYFVAM